MASIIEQFFHELDRKWKHSTGGKIELCIIGSSAIFLQTDYNRGTKDSDILETRNITPEIEAQLNEIGGKTSDLHRQFRIYLDFVNPGLPFLPQKPRFVKAPSLKNLKHFDVRLLD